MTSSDFSKQFPKWTLRHFLVLFVWLGSSFLLFWKITEPSLTFDELTTLRTIDTKNWIDFFRNYWADQQHPPLYFIIQKLISDTSVQFYAIRFIQVNLVIELILRPAYFIYPYIPVGSFLDFILPLNLFYLQISSLEFKLRWLSAVFISLTSLAWLLYFDSIKKLPIGIAVALILGSNFRILYAAQDGRPYALFVLLSSLSVITLLLHLKNSTSQKQRNYYFLASGAMLLTHYYAVFLLMSQFVMLSRNQKSRKLYIFAFAVIAVLSAVGLKVLGGFSFLRTFGYQDLFVTYQFMFANLFNFKVMSVLILFGAVSGFILKNKFRNSEYFLVSFLVLCSLGLLYFFSQMAAIFTERYVLYLLPLIVVAGFSVLESALDFLKKSIFSGGVIIVIAGFLSAMQIKNTVYSEKYYELSKHYPLKQALKAIVSDSKDTPYLIVEEHLPSLLTPYESFHLVQRSGSIDPNDIPEIKAAKLKELIQYNKNTESYFLFVNHDSNENIEIYKLEGYSQDRIFNQSSISVFKYRKNP